MSNNDDTAITTKNYYPTLRKLLKTLVAFPGTCSYCGDSDNFVFIFPKQDYQCPVCLAIIDRFANETIQSNMRLDKALEIQRGRIRERKKRGEKYPT